VAYGTLFLYLDNLAEVGEGGLHLGAHLRQRGPANSMVDKVIGESRVGCNGRVAAKGGLVIAAVTVNVGGSASDAAVLGGKKVPVMRGWRVDGEVFKKGFNVCQAVLDAINLLLVLGGDEDPLAVLLGTLAYAGGGAGARSRAAVEAGRVLVTANLSDSTLVTGPAVGGQVIARGIDVREILHVDA
jgi:hypothetical protein